MFLYRLADRLHKTVSELEQIPIEELIGWLAYLRIISREK